MDNLIGPLSITGRTSRCQFDRLLKRSAGAAQGLVGLRNDLFYAIKLICDAYIVELGLSH